MTNCSTYTGDLLISLNTEGDWDLNYINGQPCMTDGFDTAVMLAVFGEPDFWQNDITNNPNEQYISEFPEVIRHGKVNDDTLKDGIEAIKKAMRFMVDSGAASEVNVTGGVLSVYGLYWIIETIKGNITSRFTINWDKGVVAVAELPVFEGKIEPKLFHSPMLNPSGDVMTNPSGEIQLYVFEE